MIARSNTRHPRRATYYWVFKLSHGIVSCCEAKGDGKVTLLSDVYLVNLSLVVVVSGMYCTYNEVGTVPSLHCTSIQKLNRKYNNVKTCNVGIYYIKDTDFTYYINTSLSKTGGRSSRPEKNNL